MQYTILETFFLIVLANSAAVSVVVVLLVLLTPFINKRYAAKCKYWIWIFLAVQLVLPFGAVGGRLLAGSLPQERVQHISGVGKSYGSNPKGHVAFGILGQLQPVRKQLEEPIAIQAGKGGIHIALLHILPFAWMAGCLAFLFLHLLSYWDFHKHVAKNGERIRDRDTLGQVAKLQRELGITKVVEVVQYGMAKSPMAIGFTRPILLLPDMQYNKEELYFILKHEAIHLKHKDTYVKLLLVIAHAIHWFNPFIWLMQREAAVDIEMSCDEQVMKDADDAVRRAYTRALLSTLQKGCGKKAAFSTQFYGGKRVMQRRFQNILKKTGRKKGIAIWLSAAILTVSFGALAGCSIAEGSKEGNKQGNSQADGAKGMQKQTDNIGNGIDNSLGGNIDKSEDVDNEIPQDGQIYGYLSKYGNGAVMVDRQIWATPDSEYWSSDYDEDIGFKVVDAKGGDITYQFHEDCAYSVLENHQEPVQELDEAAFGQYLQEMEYPVLWVMELEGGKIKEIMEQYRP